MRELVLASASPRRKELLQRAGIKCLIRPSQAEESILEGEEPQDSVLRLARAKARSTRESLSLAEKKLPVLAADTVVVLGRKIFGKPEGAPMAAAMLTELSGKRHRVLTAWCLIGPNGQEISGLCQTLVSFRLLSQEEIQSYVATAEPLDKAGAYALQGLGHFLIDRVEGSLTNVVGLPLREALEALQNFWPKGA
jgi:septum formation protein